MAKTQKILQPQYVGKFQCIGPACEDSCCIGWRVQIDKDTYQKYRKCSDNELRIKMDENVTRNRSNSRMLNYAKIVLNGDGACPFIDGEKLCAIQRKLGEELLSVTCTTYPRMTNTINDVLEKSLTMSCPEAARQALLTVDPMQFDEIEEDNNARNNPGIVLDTRDLKLAQRPQRYFWELRIFVISLLQNRSYLLWQRLVILGLFCKNVNELVTAGKAHDITVLIDTYQSRLDQDIFRSELDSIPNQLTIQLELMKEVADIRVVTGVSSQRFVECFGEFLHGIQYTAEASKEEIGGRYVEAYDKYYQPFMEQHEYILENYLVNFVFKNLFPVNGEKHIFDNYVMLIIHYSMIKMLLIGMAGYHKENFDTHHVIKLIQSFAKVIEHNNAYVKQAFKLLKANKMNTLAYMAILTKN